MGLIFFNSFLSSSLLHNFCHLFNDLVLETLNNYWLCYAGHSNYSFGYFIGILISLYVYSGCMGMDLAYFNIYTNFTYVECNLNSMYKRIF